MPLRRLITTAASHTAPSRIDGGPWASCYHLCIDRQTNEIVVATRGNGWVEDALTDVTSRASLFLDYQVYACTFQTATTGFEQIAQMLCDLHMETGKKIVVFGHSRDCGVVVLFIIKLLGEEVRFLKSLKAYQTFRCSSFAAPPCFGPSVKMPRWVHSTIFSSIHRVDVVPRCSVGNIVKNGLCLKANFTRWRSCPWSVSPTAAPPIRDSSRTHEPDARAGRALFVPSYHRHPASDNS